MATVRQRTRRKKIKVFEKKLRRERCVGTAEFATLIIQIDPRQNSKSYLDTLIHEMLHLYNPQWSETRVSETANEMTRVIWDANYRRLKSQDICL